MLKQDERSLQNAGPLLQKVFDSLNEVVFIIETGTRIILDVNRAVETIFGYSREELIGCSASLLHVNEETSRRFVAEMTAACAARDVYETVFQMRRKDGSVFDSEHCVTPIRNEEGRIISRVCVVRDISARINIEKVLRSAALEQAAILDNTCVGIALVKNRLFVWANNRYKEMLGYRQGELSGKPVRIIYPAEEKYAEVGEVAYAAVAKGSVYETELELVRKDGSTFWAKCYGRAMDPDNLSAGTIWVVEDISKRKQAEAALAKKSQDLEDLNKTLEARIREAVDELRQSENLRDSQNRLLIDLAPEPIIVFDVGQGIIVDANANALKLFGCCREELFTTTPLSFYAASQPDALPPETSFEQYTNRVLAGEVLTLERSLVNRVGAELTCEVHLVRMPSAKRLLIRATYIDITERKQIADDLARALAMARNLNEEQRHFIGLISHELRTPLSIIDGAAQLLTLSACPDSEYLKLAHHIRSASTRLTSLVDTCLTEERIASSGWVLELRDASLREIVAETAALYQKSSENHRILTDVELLPELYPCDTAFMKIMLGNLLENAIKYSPNGGSILVRGSAGEAGFIYLEVSDQGIGISPKHIEKIFDRFYRTWEVADVPGAGLGLHLVRKIAQLHGGEVSCTSTAGSGSTFTVKLPADRCLPAES